MVRVITLATAGVCAVLAMLGAQPARAQAPDYKTWLFAEGSTNAVFGFEQEILVGNPNPTPITVFFDVFPADGSASFTEARIVPALSRYGEYLRGLVGDRQGFSLRVRSNDGPFVAERSMYWGNGLYRAGKTFVGRITDMRGGHNEKGILQAGRTWYFAEGESRFFWTFFSVANPSATPAKVKATYVDLNGNEAIDERTIAPGARETFWPSSPDFLRNARYANRTGGFSTIIESDVDIVAERQMYWGPGGNYNAGHAAAGIKDLATDWFFAEGSQGGAFGFDTWLLVLNPSADPLDVTFRFFDGSGQEIAQTTRTVGARARGQVWGGEFDVLRGKAFSTRVTASRPFAAERAVYWRGYAEGHATAGATTSAKKWAFAEGKQGGFLLYQDNNDSDKRRFNTFFALFNPSPERADVTLHFYFESPTGSVGHTVTRSIEPNTRSTFWAIEVPELANQKFATFISSTQPIVAERIVYWGANFRAGHVSLGTPLPEDFPVVAAPSARTAPGTALTVTPNRGVPGGGNTVEIEGEGFGHTEVGTQVFFGATPVPFGDFEVENSNTIRAKVPPGATGPVDVTVVTRNGTITQPGAYTYFNPFAATGQPFNTFDHRVGGNCPGNGSGCIVLGDPRIGNALPFEAVVRDVGRRDPVALANSCRAFGGSERFMEEVLAELRLRYNTNRWALNIKRGNQGLSEDIITYFYGPEGADMRDSTQVFIVDIIGNHCNPANRFGASPAWIDQTNATRLAGTVGRWTLGNVCKDPRYRDARRPNGEWLFPECR